VVVVVVVLVGLGGFLAAQVARVVQIGVPWEVIKVI